MRKELAVISSPEFGEIRSVMVNGEPLFVAKDVCLILGIRQHRDAIAKLEVDERGCNVEVPTLGGRQYMATVNEYGLYTLIFQSRKPEAKKFRRWVSKEVLPSIHKYGFYIAPYQLVNINTEEKLKKCMLAEMMKFISDSDMESCADKFNVSKDVVPMVLAGKIIDSSIMGYLQNRAIANREKWFDAYGQGRMLEVLGILTGKK